MSDIKNVLVVDDDEHISELISLCVEQTGKNTVRASSAEEALQILAKFPEKFEAIITDYQMPKMNGVELIEHISVHEPSIQRMILVSSLVDINEDIKKLSIEMSDLKTLRKPFSPTELIRLLS